MNNSINADSIKAKRDKALHNKLKKINNKWDDDKPFYAQTTLPYLTVFPEKNFDQTAYKEFNRPYYDRYFSVVDPTVGPCPKYFQYAD